MSMTKRYLDSLPQDEQDAILGEVDPDGCEVEYEDEDDIPGSDEGNDWMTDKRKSAQFMAAMDIYYYRWLERRTQ